MNPSAMRVLLPLLALCLAGCGPEPADVSGPWAGNHNLIITGSETAAGTEGITVTQKGGDLSFHFAGCEVKAAASGAQTFDVYDFQCDKRVNQKSWTLYGDGSSRISTGPSSFNMTLSGDAESNDTTADFSWTFNGSRQ